MQAVQITWQTVIDSRVPIGPGDRFPLRIRNRHHRHLRILAKYRMQFGQIEPTMERGYRWGRIPSREREPHEIEMGVNDVEVAGFSQRLLHQHRHGGIAVEDPGIQSQGSSADRFEASGSDRISARKQGHVVTEPNQLFGEVGHDPFRSSIEFRWNALPQGGNLGNSHRTAPLIMAYFVGRNATTRTSGITSASIFCPRARNRSRCVVLSTWRYMTLPEISLMTYTSPLKTTEPL